MSTNFVAAAAPAAFADIGLPPAVQATLALVFF